MSDPVIRVENLGKKYTLRHQQEGRQYKALRDVLVDRAHALFKPRLKQPSNTREEFWALQDVSFEVQQGDRVGIIGRNGAGKSTLLKVLSRITRQSTGSIRLKGRVASLLEVGTGFHPELTGRENIYLNGAILGMSKAEITRKFDEIVAFAEVERFLDTPVKRYSSGMYVRLAFAVAAHLEPEILVIDEVLAVGDAQFQKKCLGKMEDVSKREGRTVLFVSHNMAAIRTLCSQGIVLESGRIICHESIDRCIAAYEMQNSCVQQSFWRRPPTQSKNSLSIIEVQATVSGDQPHLTLDVDLVLESCANHQAAFLAIDILDPLGVGLMQALPRLEGFIKDTERNHQLRVTIDLPPIVPGQYRIGVWIGSHNTMTLDEVREAVMFEVFESPTIGRSFPHTSDHGYIVPLSSVTANKLSPISV